MTSNYVDSTGLHLQALADIVTELENGFIAIYGASINLDPSSPDGQMIALFAQAQIDILDVIADVYSSFSPSAAVGSALDQRCAINGLVRQGATRTQVNVNIETDRTVILVGETANAGTPFTVSDTGSNQFYLVDSTTINAGTTEKRFIAVEPGAIEITYTGPTGGTGPSGSVNKIETLTLGVISALNSGLAVVRGVDEESDAALRLRRAQSVAIPSMGYLEGLRGALRAVDGVSDAIVYENNTSTTDGDGIPGHSIWAVVEGGTSADIAEVIHIKRPVGVGMVGAVTVEITQDNSYPIDIQFDRPTDVDLEILLTVTSLTDAYDPADDIAAMKQFIFDNIVYTINQTADYSAISALIKGQFPLAVIMDGDVGPTAPGASGPIAQPTTIDSRWIISTENIVITVA